MLAYDEHGVLDEFVEKNGITVCSNCHRLYHQYLRDQVPGMREREYDEWNSPSLSIHNEYLSDGLHSW